MTYPKLRGDCQCQPAGHYPLTASASCPGGSRDQVARQTGPLSEGTRPHCASWSSNCMAYCIQPLGQMTSQRTLSMHAYTYVTNGLLASQRPRGDPERLCDLHGVEQSKQAGPSWMYSTRFYSISSRSAGGREGCGREQETRRRSPPTGINQGHGQCGSVMVGADVKGQR